MTPVRADDKAFPDGTLIWKAKHRPGQTRVFGAEPRIAAYLWFEVKVGAKFTMKQLRDALGEHGPNADEHLNRRLRSLRQRGWELPSYKDLAGLKADEYLLAKKGDRVWLGEGERPPAISQKTRRLVFDRDGNRCVICGIGAGEPYPEDNKLARMTIGHRTAGARLFNATAENLQAECARCNEPARDAIPDPYNLAEVMALVKALSAKEKARLHDWVAAGVRQRDALDSVYDKVRRLSASERAQVLASLRP